MVLNKSPQVIKVIDEYSMTTKKFKLVHIKEKIQPHKTGTLFQIALLRKVCKTNQCHAPFHLRHGLQTAKRRANSERASVVCESHNPGTDESWVPRDPRVVFPIFLTLRPFNTDPRVMVPNTGPWWPPQPQNYFHCHFITLNFATVMNCNVNTFGDRSFPKELWATG